MGYWYSWSSWPCRSSGNPWILHIQFDILSVPCVLLPTLVMATQSTSSSKHMKVNQLQVLAMVSSGGSTSLEGISQGESGNWINLHIFFASKARLNWWINLNPMPPSYFGFHSLSDVARCIPRLGEFVRHQSVWSLANFSHISSDSKSLDVAYVGNIKGMPFIMISFPPFVNHLPDHKEIN